MVMASKEQLEKGKSVALPSIHLQCNAWHHYLILLVGNTCQLKPKRYEIIMDYMKLIYRQMVSFWRFISWFVNIKCLSKFLISTFQLLDSSTLDLPILTQCSCSKLLRASVVEMKQPIITPLRNQNLSPAKIEVQKRNKERKPNINFFHNFMML